MRPALPISVCLLAVGCISTNVQRLDQAVRPARSPDSVAVLLEKPDQPYTVIAVVKSSSSAVFDSFDDLRKKMIAEAALLGGDALILGPESKKSTLIFNTVGFVQSEWKDLAGEVIVFDRTARSTIPGRRASSAPR
ncbi:MAG: hypothetical protein GTN78_00420 [Gemmatimonadales bacterium]|nr:hypothetical protein [Gemmatimonadales bacterium]NIQ98656.1 hypothetical protein [Gemmatimonadales bacterium]